MNNFVFGSADPLLYNQIVPRTSPNLTDPTMNGVDLKNQLDSLTAQYQQYQQYQNMQQNNQQKQKDLLGEIDELLKGMDNNMINELSNNPEFNELNTYIQALIQEEIMKTVKWKINSNDEAIPKMNRLKDIINNMYKSKTEEEKKNLSELNDYIKNYSDLTFNEYKKLKEIK